MTLNTPEHEMLVAWQRVNEQMKRSQGSSEELNLQHS